MALTEDFTYKLGDDGVILNPNSTTMPFVDIISVKGLDSSPFRTTERDHEGVDGGFMDAVYEKGRSVILEGTAYVDAEDVETFLDGLKYNYAPSRNLINFYFKKPGVTERYLKVKPLGARYDVDQLRRLGYTDIQFTMFAEDPRIYSSSLRDYSIEQTPVIFSGRSYPRSYSYSYGDAIMPNVVNMFVGGNRTTPPTFYMTGPATYPTIINDTLNTSMRFNIEIPLGSTLVVDTYYHTVKLDGQNRRSTMDAPTWFHFVPGDNYIRYTSTTNGGSILTGQCFDAWR